MRDVLLQPFRSHKYESLKAILIERRGLTTPERVNKVISGERIGTDIPSRFLRRLQKTAGFGTKAVVGKAVIRQAFIRQMLASIRAHLATQPDSATLESLAVLADRALAAEEDVEERKPGVARIKVEETTKLVGLLEDLSGRIKKIETMTTSERKRNKGRGRVNNNYALRLHLLLMFRPQVLLITNLVIIEINRIMLDLSFRRRMCNKMLDLSSRRRIHSETTPIKH